MFKILTSYVTIPLWAYVLLFVLFFFVGYAWAKNFWLRASEVPATTPRPEPAGRHRLREPPVGEEEAMGQLRIGVAYVKQAPHVSARILEWAGDDADQVRTSTLGPTLTFIIPEQIMAGKGPLQFIENGPDILEQFVTGQEKTWQAGSGEVTSVTDPDEVPTLESIQFTGDGLTVALGLVDDPDKVTVNWGDGTEDQSRHHAYERAGLYLISCETLGQVPPRSEAYVYVDRFSAEQPAES
jgi:hypothetical protein